MQNNLLFIKVTKGEVKMKAEYINPFFDSSSVILNEMCGISANKKQPYIKQGMTLIKTITITIGVTGKLKGNIIISMDRMSALNLASVMMGGMTISELDEITMSAISELGNMIAGRAGMIFSNNEIDIDITPPVSALNHPDSKINYSMSTICVPFVLSNGSEFEIDIALNEEQ